VLPSVVGPSVIKKPHTEDLGSLGMLSHEKKNCIEINYTSHTICTLALWWLNPKGEIRNALLTNEQCTLKLYATHLCTYCTFFLTKPLILFYLQVITLLNLGHNSATVPHCYSM
jgi:hypothetical protein